MQPNQKFKVMAKKFFRKLKSSSELRIDVRSLSLDEYRMISALVSAAFLSYRNGHRTQCVGSFGISFIDIRVFAHPDSLNTLAKLKKNICV